VALEFDPTLTREITGMSFACAKRFLICVAIWVVSGAGDGAVAPDVVAVRLTAGLSRPVFLASPPNDPTRLFVVEQHTGQIRIVDRATGQVGPVAFLSITGLATGGEQGMLGLAFHPEFASNGLFFVNVTVAGSGATEVRRYQVSADDPDLADPASEDLILGYDQPFANHNAGWMAFGPDGFLYIATGDGGSGGDPGNRAQDLGQLLGKILRIDVDRDDFPADPTHDYGIPLDNPFASTAGAHEIWAYGLRNPWRCSFDWLTGDFYIGDVGQGVWEEIDFQPAASGGGENYGWNLREASHCFPPVAGDPVCGDLSLVDPIYEYRHASAPDGGFSVTGGYVYRGPIAAIDGHYFFADFVTRQVWSFVFDGATRSPVDNWTAQLSPPVGTVERISSFGEDADGNLYIVDLGGEIFKLVQTSSDLCNGDTVVLDDWIALAGENRPCAASHSLSTRNGVTVQGGARVDFSAPEVILGPGLVVDAGGVFSAGPPGR